MSAVMETHWRAAPQQAAAPARSVPLVFVLDGDRTVRDALARVAGAAGWKAETFGSAREFLAHPRPSAPSCLVLEVGLPDLNGLEMQQRLADRPEMPIVFISSYGDVRTAVRAMKAGAVEFFIKPLVDDMLLGALHHGIERSRAELARRADMEALRSRYASLTCRERDILTHVVSGRLNKQAGAELGISEITVKAHRGKMMRKMGARCVPELVNMAAKLFAKA